MMQWKNGARLGVVVIWAVALGTLVGMTASSGTEREAVEVPQNVLDVSFADEVMPILEARCVDCHGGVDDTGAEVVEEGLNLTTYEGVMAGSTWGTVVEAGDAESSLLLQMIIDGDMPKDAEEPMPESEIEVLRAWIAEGAQNNE